MSNLFDPLSQLKQIIPLLIAKNTPFSEDDDLEKLPVNPSGDVDPTVVENASLQPKEVSSNQQTLPQREIASLPNAEVKKQPKIEANPSPNLKQEEIVQSLVDNASESEIDKINQRSRDLRGLGMFANAGSQLASAISLGAAKPVEIGNDVIKAADRELSDAKTALDLKDEEALRNPNSPASKAVRDGLREMFPNLKIPDNVSAQQLKAVGINLGSLTSAKEMADARRDSASERNQNMKARQEELNFLRDRDRNDKLQKEQRLTDSQVKIIAGYDNPIKMIDDILAEKPKFDTGPLAGRWNKISNWVGLDDAEKSGFRSNVGDYLAQYIKGISGAAVSDKERKALLENLPSMNDNDKSFIVKARKIKRRLEQLREVELSLMEKQGKNVSNFKSENLTQSKDPKAEEFAEMHNVTYEQAKKILDKRRDEQAKKILDKR
jgi:hypothetical protein